MYLKLLWLFTYNILSISNWIKMLRLTLPTYQYPEIIFTLKFIGSLKTMISCYGMGTKNFKRQGNVWCRLLRCDVYIWNGPEIYFCIRKLVIFTCLFIYLTVVELFALIWRGSSWFIGLNRWVLSVLTYVFFFVLK